MYSRPKPGETEEDLLRLQEEFFKNKAAKDFKPAAQIVPAKSRVKAPDAVEKNDGGGGAAPGCVMRGIVERRNVAATEIDATRFSRDHGFPKAKRRQGNLSAVKGVSIFAQQNKKSRIEKMEVVQSTAMEPQLTDEFVMIKKHDRSAIVTGDEAVDIHHENMNVLNKLSEAEILDEQKKLMDNLDPDIIKFLKAKRQLGAVEPPITPAATVNVPIAEIESANDIMAGADADKWLHFDVIESEKFRWMENVTIPKTLESGEPYEARFDFAGWLLPYTESMITDESRSLYHHGEDPGRPGYTLKELFQLCRSNVNQQRILALNTIANILSLASTGVYEGVIDMPVEQTFFVVRMCLDENVPTVLNASLRAMDALFCNRIDETCLDGLMGFGDGWVQPSLSADDGSVKREDEEEVNDQQLAEMDLVKCLARTDVVIRIRYILSTVRPPLETINYCLSILIRLMRDSHAVMTDVYNCDGLFECIIEHFVPKTHQLGRRSATSGYGMPVLLAVKLLRVAAMRSRHITQELIEKYGVMEPICSYLASDVAANVNEIRIQAEALNLFAVMLRYGLATSYVAGIECMLMRSLDYHLRNTNVDCTYALQNHFGGIANVLSLAGDGRLLEQCVSKYCGQTSTFIDFQCGRLQIVSSLLTCVVNYPNVVYNVESCVEALLNSEGFRKITENATLGSNLLCPYDSYKTAANYRTAEAAVWNTSEHVVPCLQTKSCLPFLAALARFVDKSSDKIKLLFLRHPNVTDYLAALKNAPKLNLVSNWFTRVESKFVASVLRIVVSVRRAITNVAFYYELAVKTLCVYSHEQKNDVRFVLGHVVFNSEFFGSDVLMKTLSLDDDNCLGELPQMYECYAKILGLDKESFLFTSNLTLDVRLGNFLPVDWIFLPIVKLYAESETLNDQQRLTTLYSSLRWILLYEGNFPELSACVNATDRFCRIACVFLCSNSVFLDATVHGLLERCLKMLVSERNYPEIDFDRQIQGLNNFQDFYVQLLEQYQSVSYGDPLFANFILLPLAQRQNVKWRKVFWSEYTGVAQIINLTAEQLFLDVKEFLEPSETDRSLMESYVRCLRGGILDRNPLLRGIIIRHVENYRRSRKK